MLLALSIAMGCFALAAVDAAHAQALDARTEIEPFVMRLASEGCVDEERTRRILSAARVSDSVLKSIQRPAESMPWHRYRRLLVTGTRVDEGVEFARKHARLLAEADSRFGVPAEIITAIIGIESAYGANRGSHRVLDSLATLGFRYQNPRRSDFFRSELESLFLLACDEKIDLLEIKGSYAGAIGIPQFIPSSYRNYAVDFDEDGHRDLVNSWADAIGSVANYLAEHGWSAKAPIAVEAKVKGDAFHAIIAKGIKPSMTMESIEGQGVSMMSQDGGTLQHQSPEALAALLEFEVRDGHEYWLGFDNFYTITRYNHSRLYALAIFQLSEMIRERIAG